MPLAGAEVKGMGVNPSISFLKPEKQNPKFEKAAQDANRDTVPLIETINFHSKEQSPFLKLSVSDPFLS
jgi:hypothetical protein